jgi:hypothetical protein
MANAFKFVSWIVLVLAAAYAVVGALIFGQPPLALAYGIISVLVFITWHSILKWVFGIRRLVRRHLGVMPRSAVLLEKEIGANRLIDVRRALERMSSHSLDGSSRRLGWNQFNDLSHLQTFDENPAGLRWITTETQDGDFERYPTNCLYFLMNGDVPFVGYIFNSDDRARQYGIRHVHDEGDGHISSGPAESGCKLQVLAFDVEAAGAAIRAILHEASLNSIYRGKLLLVEPIGFGRVGHRIRVMDRPSVDEDRIVLPATVLEVLRRSVEARTKYQDLLRRHRHNCKTGVLLHGPPGTGKTLLAKRLIGICESHTAIVPSGMDEETIREVFRLANYLQPALIIIEDVDLLAGRRDTNSNVTGLQVLMNELDGLAPGTDAIVLLTTNRAEVLEPALAARPGRVNQAIEFPLPDAEDRRRLLRVFASLVDSSSIDLPLWMERTAGASPAFIEELVKKAILFAASRHDDGSEMKLISLVNEDFDRAMHELVIFGSVLTSRILGFANPKIDETIRSVNSTTVD